MAEDLSFEELMRLALAAHARDVEAANVGSQIPAAVGSASGDAPSGEFGLDLGLIGGAHLSCPLSCQHLPYACAHFSYASRGPRDQNQYQSEVLSV